MTIMLITSNDLIFLSPFELILDFFTACQEGILIKTLLSTQPLAFCSLTDLQLTNGMNVISFILNGQRDS